MISEELYNNRKIAITHFENMGGPQGHYLVRFMDYDTTSKNNLLANIGELANGDQQLKSKINELLEKYPDYSGAKVLINGVSKFSQRRINEITENIESNKTRIREVSIRQGKLSIERKLRLTGTDN